MSSLVLVQTGHERSGSKHHEQGFKEGEGMLSIVIDRGYNGATSALPPEEASVRSEGGKTDPHATNGSNIDLARVSCGSC